jgi:DNA-3-methyladenine glycosylase
MEATAPADQRLDRDFFARLTLDVARDLLGRHLVRVLDGERLSGLIVEVEAYVGEDDQACHARSGPTARNAAMYGPPGHAYVYLIYGMHHCLNVVTEREGFPAAILLRALEPVEGVGRIRAHRAGRPEGEWTNGPGKLCQALAIDRAFDGADLCAPDAQLFIEAGCPVVDRQVLAGPRIGVRGDETALNVPWRFFLRRNSYVSRPR